MRKARQEEVLSLVDALRQIEEAAFNADVSVPISAEDCERFVLENVQTASEERALDSTGRWWTMMVQDYEENGMYVTLFMDDRLVHLSAGKGKGPALKAFADRHFGRPFASAARRLEAQFGRPFWTGSVLSNELQ